MKKSIKWPKNKTKQTKQTKQKNKTKQTKREETNTHMCMGNACTNVRSHAPTPSEETLFWFTCTATKIVLFFNSYLQSACSTCSTGIAQWWGTGNPGNGGNMPCTRKNDLKMPWSLPIRTRRRSPRVNTPLKCQSVRERSGDYLIFPVPSSVAHRAASVSHCLRSCLNLFYPHWVFKVFCVGLLSLAYPQLHFLL